MPNLFKRGNPYTFKQGNQAGKKTQFVAGDTEQALRGKEGQEHGRMWTRAIKAALMDYRSTKDNIKRGQALYKIAMKVVESATKGAWPAIDEIGNRLEGRAAQSIKVEDNRERLPEEMTDAELLGEIGRIRALRAAKQVRDPAAAAPDESEPSGIH
jgi:hypothetical protein